MIEIDFQVKPDGNSWKIVFEREGRGILTWSREPIAWSAFWQTLISSRILNAAS